MLGVDTLCPFGEVHLETEAFQQHIRHVIDYVESETVTAQISANWSLIGDYQDTVKIVHTFSRCDFPSATRGCPRSEPSPERDNKN